MRYIKNLAKDTAIYGITSIVARFLNYLLVPLYTRKFIPEEYGIVTEMYAYVTFLIIILTYGMETGFFRFSSKEKNYSDVYTTSILGLLSTSVLFIIGVNIFSSNIAIALDYGNNIEYIRWFSFILGIDAFCTITFAKLRYENRALRFSSIKLINVFVNIIMNLFFIVLCPYLIKSGYNNSFIDFMVSLFLSI